MCLRIGKDEQLEEGRVGKTITIKGVNKGLYERFSLLTTMIGTRGSGKAFSRLIIHHRRNLPIFGPLKFRKLFHRKNEHFEVIQDLSDLRITKKDLVEAGENVRFIFKNIKRLEIEESVDKATFLKYFYRIFQVGIIKPDNIPPLVWHSVFRPYVAYKPLDDELDQITIRNVDSLAYNEFVAACKLNDQRVGEAVNDILAKFIPEVEILLILTHELTINPYDVLVITSLDDLKVTEKDFSDIGERKVLFHRIGHLKIAPDVTKDRFVQSIAGIYNCDSVTLSPSLPKLLKLSRIKKFPRKAG